MFWRKVGEADWRKVNELPYAPPFRFGQDDPSIFYEHSPGVVGLYEYAVRAYDAFGDLTPLSAPHKVFFPDLMPPLGPEITSIVIDRPGKTLYDEVYATIYFHKDSLEDDFVRYVPSTSMSATPRSSGNSLPTSILRQEIRWSAST